MAGKFSSLKNYILQSNQSTITFSFQQIEEILGEKLCDSAHKYSAYWSKNRTDTCVSAFTEAGFSVKDLDLQEQTVTITRGKK